MRHLIITLAMLLSVACSGTTPAPTLPPPAARTLPATYVAMPTLLATDTLAPTSTPIRQPTSTAAPTHTRTPLPTATYTPRPTDAPTRMARTPTPLPTATASSSRRVEPFNADAFVERLRNTHFDFQMFGAHVGFATRGMGECRVAFYYWDIVVHAPAYANVPEAWLSLTSEYIALMDRAVEIMRPIIHVCQAGGGTIDEETDRQILTFFDQAQNRLYQMTQEAAAMK